MFHAAAFLYFDKLSENEQKWYNKQVGLITSGGCSE